MVKLAMIQLQGAYEKAKNVEKACARVGEAARQGAQIICLQELFNTIYFCYQENPKYNEWAEPIPGPTTDAVAEVARREGVVVIVPLFESDRDERGETAHYNAAAVLGPKGELIGKYRKNSIPLSKKLMATSGNEKFYFRNGNLGFPVFPTPFGINIGILLCYDRHFPEASRCLALNGADVMFVPTATWAVSKPIWPIELQAHAVFNQFFVGGVNRVGYDEGGNPEADFFGSSMFVSPTGEILATASDTDEDIVYLEPDVELIRQVRDAWGCYRDRRPDAYHALVR